MWGNNLVVFVSENLALSKQEGRKCDSDKWHVLTCTLDTHTLDIRLYTVYYMPLHVQYVMVELLRRERISSATPGTNKSYTCDAQMEQFVPSDQSVRSSWSGGTGLRSGPVWWTEWPAPHWETPSEPGSQTALLQRPWNTHTHTWIWSKVWMDALYTFVCGTNLAQLCVCLTNS